ncbi:hypothetical protein [Sphingomicrobium flavum]|nr:hypothetical protein [Sphingomicrobium flavum]
MNWFALGGGAAMIIAGISIALGRAPKLPKASGIVLALAGAVIIYLGLGR